MSETSSLQFWSYAPNGLRLAKLEGPVTVIDKYGYIWDEVKSLEHIDAPMTVIVEGEVVAEVWS
jgi:hypothetical protein